MTRLVLTRKLNESIAIHSDGFVMAWVKITRINGGSVRISIDANENIDIDREELFDKKYPVKE